MLLRLILTFGALLCASTAVAEPRPPLKAASAVRVGNYGSPSTMIENREQVRQIVGELAALRGKSWRLGDTRQSCYATLVLLDKGKQVGLFRLTPGVVVEKGKTSYSLSIADRDMPRIRKLLAEIPAPKCD